MLPVGPHHMLFYITLCVTHMQKVVLQPLDQLIEALVILHFLRIASFKSSEERRIFEIEIFC